MKIRFGTSAAICALTVSLAATAAFADTVKPRFVVIPRTINHNQMRASGTTTWNFTYTYESKNYSDAFVGTNPASGAVTTTMPVEIIPVALSFQGFKTNPTKKNGVAGVGTVIDSVVASPIFSSGLDFQEDSTDIGSTQYVDAFQKLSLWNLGGNAGNYHVLLGTPTIAKTLKLKVPAGDGAIGTPIDGIKVLEANINWFDQQVNAEITKLKIPSTTLPIFITTQTYLTSGGCCIGGYHSVHAGSTPYSVATYIVNTGKTVTFSQDVGALSHEISEWMDDPFTNNNSPCGIYEVGDPLERNANYGLIPYTLNGFVYHLQDEAAPPYFGAPASDTLGGYDTFQGEKLSVCENGS